MASKCEHDRVRQTCSACLPEKVYEAYAAKAKQRNLNFSLTLDEFETLVSMPCHWCGKYGVMGIDRVDSRIGYTNSGQIPNCVPCCKRCNFMKGTMSADEFVRQAEMIAAHQQKLREEKQKQPKTVKAKPTTPVVETKTIPVQFPRFSHLDPKAQQFLNGNTGAKK
jgi:hypothetical protein